MRFRTAVLLLAATLLPATSIGCALGPRALEGTHGHYAQAVRLVEEEQTLSNIVRVRYDESPLALNVNSVTAQFDFSAGAEARPFFSTEATGNLFRSFTTVLPFAQVGTSSRPTFSFDPADDGTTVRQFLTPISADALVFLFRNEPRIDVVLRLWVERMNNLPNLPASDEFYRAAKLIQAAKEKGLLTIQPDVRDEEASGPVPASAMTASAAVEAARDGLRYEPRDGGRSWVLLRRVAGLALQVMPGAESSPELGELWGLLGLRPGLPHYRLRIIEQAAPDPVAGPAGDTIHLTARSTSRVYHYLGSGVEVPPEHQAEGVVRPLPGEEGQTAGVFQVHVSEGKKPPPHAFVCVRYRGHVYYVDDRDVDSKATLALIMQLSRLDFKRQKISAGPALTLPVGR